MKTIVRHSFIWKKSDKLFKLGDLVQNKVTFKNKTAQPIIVGNDCQAAFTNQYVIQPLTHLYLGLALYQQLQRYDFRRNVYHWHALFLR